MAVRSVSLLLVIFAGIYGFPDDVDKCRIDDEKCLLRSANKVIHKYYSGIEDIKLVSMDPMKIDRMKINRNSGAVTVNGVVNNITIVGYSKGKIEKISGFDKNKMEIKYKAPNIKFKGKYNVKAGVLGIPLNGQGHFTLVFKNFDALFKFTLTRETRNGKEYFKINDIIITYDVTDGEIDLPDWGSFVNSIINASFGLFKDAIKPIVTEYWPSIFKEKFVIFDLNPINELFLE